MCNKLPIRNFRFIDPGVFINELGNMINTYNCGSDHNHRCKIHNSIDSEEKDQRSCCNICKNSVLNLDEGYLIEYDIEFPNSHHNYYHDFPLALENLVIDPKWLSEAQREVTKPDKSTRLTTNLFNKRHYVSFLENLIMYMDLGAKITTVHKVIKL